MANLKNEMLDDLADKIIKENNGNYNIVRMKVASALKYLIVIDKHVATGRQSGRIFSPQVSEPLVTVYTPTA